MTLELRFRCPLPSGLHARPASLLAEIAGRFPAKLRLVNERSGTAADCSSVIELVAAGVLFEDPCRLTADGERAAEAFGALSEFITGQLADCDEPLVVPELQSHQLSPALMEALTAEPETPCLQGQPLSPGLATGELLQLSGAHLPLQLRSQRCADALLELGQLERAMGGVELELSAQLESAGHEHERQILRASLALLRDPALDRRLHEQLGLGLSAAGAVVSALEDFAQQVGQSSSSYLRERAADLRGIGLLLLAHLGVQAEHDQTPALTAPVIIAADTLAPSQLLALDRSFVAGLLLGEAGATSHAAILARSFGIPAISAPPAAFALPTDVTCILDGARGLLLPGPSAAVQKHYLIEDRAAALRSARELETATGPARSQDGRAVEIAANIASAAEAASALLAGADGVGLFRTELLFYGRDSAPDEDEQFEIYRATLQALPGRSVIFRTIDIGGDKPLDYLNLPREANPFLGFRGLRIYERHHELIDTQLRALLRAAAYGSMRIMAPMVSTFEEAAGFKRRVHDRLEQLRSEGLSVDDAVAVGVMIEVPSAALIAGQISQAVDFVSIGSNDLCQYTFAADRGNPAVAGLHNTRHPAFLRLLRLLCEGTRAAGCWTGLCGEMAGDPRNLPLLLGLGLDELSMSAPSIPGCKRALRSLNSVACRELLDRACDCTTAEEVEALLAGHAAQSTEALPLLAPELVLLNSASTSKAAAIHELTQALFAQGRSDTPDAVEAAVWAREQTYSTGLGHGCAIPHCKSSAVSHATLAVMRPAQPLEWGSLDNAPVHTVILLAMPEQTAAAADTARAADNQHLKVFAALARRLMREEFRDALSSASDPAAICELLSEQLDLNSAEVRT